MLIEGQPEPTMPKRPRGEKRPAEKIIGILVAITCLTMGGAAQAACRAAADAYQLQRDARVLDIWTTPEQLESMQIAGLLARAAAGFQTATEELLCRGWSQSQIDEALRRMGHRRS
jgi:hypothetical protein